MEMHSMIRFIPMKRPWRASLLPAAARGSAIAGQPLWAKGRRPPTPVKPQFSGWVVYWDPAGGEDAARVWNKLEEVSLFACEFDPTGKLVPATPDMDKMYA